MGGVDYMRLGTRLGEGLKYRQKSLLIYFPRSNTFIQANVVTCLAIQYRC